MRLGDLDALREDWLENGENEYVYDTNSFLSSIDDQPTIDPETLHIVQDLRSINKRLKAVVKVQLEQLREKTAEIDELCEKVADLDEKLHRVTAERDAVKHDIEEAMKISEQEVPGFLCEFCAKNPFCVKCSEPEWRGAQKEE